MASALKNYARPKPVPEIHIGPKHPMVNKKKLPEVTNEDEKEEKREDIRRSRVVRRLSLLEKYSESLRRKIKELQGRGLSSDRERSRYKSLKLRRIQVQVEIGQLAEWLALGCPVNPFVYSYVSHIAGNGTFNTPYASDSKRGDSLELSDCEIEEEDIEEIY